MVWRAPMNIGCRDFSLPDGRLVFRGFCYRPEPSGLADRVAARRGTTVQGMSSAEIVREIRG